MNTPKPMHNMVNGIQVHTIVPNRVPLSNGMDTAVNNKQTPL